MALQSRQKTVKESAPESELERLKKELEDLKKSIQSGAVKTKQENNMDDEDNNDINISSDSYIKVMSLTPYQLTLTTEPYGRGKKFDFHNFGEVKRILYHHLTDIMEEHPNFVNEGYFVILNKDVVRKHGLDDVYAKILTKEKLELIFAGNDSDAVNLFKACGDAQRQFIVNMIHDKMLKGEFVDLNLLDRFSRIIDPSGEYSIAKIGEDMKKSLEANKIKV